ncbi:bifunctional [glutamine synthetase] adenylyltransferase/[glutamine synthetase]-adenylyl-L-tyrosine phosphorylase [Mesorhizobium sp. Z1-4]|uniref:bifunctional [glutamine synthetase] adenylyltransferase/[glutamine synthetase]-adenylyl-L-tyrosine phosphorylase n=1 Tax=Mesorhizobium sp. Z1-4 TaxID=2448478 RepID=UPI000FDC61EE|nr:bifunctional [glutamine synthetase] adenylyltransferase/[glutamine synthetase]-adenylyl-L-tyrosine phosphorylase [Mesorhizobium sp. Z1-4]
MSSARKKQAGGAGAWFGTPPKSLRPLDADHAVEQREDLAEAAGEAGAVQLAALLAGADPLADFISAAMDLSPFLRGCLKREPSILERLFDTSVAMRLAAIDAEIAALADGDDLTETGLMRGLRVLKREAHVLIALGNLAGEVEAQETTARLSRLADNCVGAAIRFLLRQAHKAGKLQLPDPSDPEKDSGWIVLGMGKLGACELNFSSDIDLIVFFDPNAPAIVDRYESADHFVRMTRQLVRILQDRTEHGYVFRTDLRLRPDPGSTPLAIPVEAALHYYESRGQNWERAAMIKARAIAGDLKAGKAFLAELRPYVWRKYLDYAAIADVHSIKRQIHAHKGFGDIAVRGHNVKLGRGGIREIEFFVQTQQLIAGGRFPELRGRETTAMLMVLAERGWISDEAAETLTSQYWFLRDVEHAIQIVADEQTHTLPEEDEGLERVARLLGYRDADAFSDVFRKALKLVESHYAALFETAPQLSSGIGNLVFTGEGDDPGTLQTLSELGFERASDISRVIRTWHYGRYRATQSAEARERLTELTPALLQAFGGTRRADEALLRFDEFLGGLPAGIQLFSLLHSNPGLLKLLATIMGAAPRLAAIITRRPHVFDGLLDPALLSELPSKAYLDERLTAFLQGATLHEEILDRLRVFAAEQKFLIGMRLLTGSIDAARAGKAFSDLADLTIAAALEAVMAEFALRHGKVAGGRIVVLGMGKLGSRELTAGSDVDLILLYEHDADAEYSTGDKELAPAHYFARLTQRLIAAVSAPTAEGVLYELDLRLRPSGNKGPVATHVDAFGKYQLEQAETWEHMALTRARIVAGDPELAARVEAEIEAVLGLTRDPAKIRQEAAEMRKLIAEEKPPRDNWDIKLIAGGLIDLEFVAQVATLTGQVGTEHRQPSTIETLSRLRESFADAQTRADLVAAHNLYTTLSQIIRICLTGPLEPEDVPPGLADLMLASTDLPDMAVLQSHVEETSRKVDIHFGRLLRGKMG